MRLLGFFALIFGVLAAHAAAAPVAAAAPSAAAYYAAALDRMNQEPPVENAAYTVAVRSTGASFFTNREAHGHVTIGWNIGGNLPPEPKVNAVYRASDRLTGVQTPKGWGTTASPIFDPTWSGVDDLIHYGWHGPPESTLAARAHNIKATLPQTIATVRAFGVAFYHVADAGTATCANGDPGHAVHLTAWNDPQAHPLTDAVIDLRSGKLCALRFGVRQPGAISVNGLVTLHLGDVSGRTLVSGERIEINAHVLGIQVKHIVSHIAFRHIVFPATLPATDLTP